MNIIITALAFVSGLILSPWVSPKFYIGMGKQIGYINGLLKGMKMITGKEK